MRINSLLTIFFFVGLVSFYQANGQDLTALNASIQQLQANLNQVNWIGGASQLSYTNEGVNLHNYMYRDALVYDDIFQAYQMGVFSKMGAPAGFDDKTYSSALWNTKRGIRIGNVVQSGNNDGILVKVPAGFNVLWLRVFNDVWEAFRVQSAVQQESDVGRYVCGLRSVNEISPDGGAPDSYTTNHIWCPIPLYFPGNYWVFNDFNSENWISGIAFGKNLWNHAKNSAIAYAWAINGGTGVEFDNAAWNGDILSRIVQGKINELYVPVVVSGKNKIIYMMEHNSNWVGTMHGDVTVNDYKVERFRTSYDNPFAAHYSSKLYSRYVATYVPAAYLNPGDKFLKLRIDMSGSEMPMYFRELGTHDYI